MEVGLERFGDLAREVRPDRVARDAADDLADEVALREGVVARRRARFPPGRLGRQARRAQVPVGELLGGERLLPSAQPRGVPHDMAHLDVLLAVGGEFRPVGRDRGVEVELAAIVQHQRDQECHRLGRRPDVRQRVAFPWLRLLRVGPASPDVHHRLAVDIDGDRRADVGTRIELSREGLEHRLELRLAGSVHLCHGAPFSGSAGCVSTPAASSRPATPAHCRQGQPIECDGAPSNAPPPFRVLANVGSWRARTQSWWVRDRMGWRRR